MTNAYLTMRKILVTTVFSMLLLFPSAHAETSDELERMVGKSYRAGYSCGDAACSIERVPWGDNTSRDAVEYIVRKAFRLGYQDGARICITQRRSQSSNSSSLEGGKSVCSTGQANVEIEPPASSTLFTRTFQPGTSISNGMEIEERLGEILELDEGIVISDPGNLTLVDTEYGPLVLTNDVNQDGFVDQVEKLNLGELFLAPEIPEQRIEWNGQSELSNPYVGAEELQFREKVWLNQFPTNSATQLQGLGNTMLGTPP